MNSIRPGIFIRITTAHYVVAFFVSSNFSIRSFFCYFPSAFLTSRTFSMHQISYRFWSVTSAVKEQSYLTNRKWVFVLFLILFGMKPSCTTLNFVHSVIINTSWTWFKAAYVPKIRDQATRSSCRYMIDQLRCLF